MTLLPAMFTPADTAYSIAAIRAAEAGLPAPARLFDDPCAAARDPRRGLRRAGRGGLFLLEGVIGYISEDATHRLFAFVADAGGPGARLALTYGEGTFYPDTAAERVRRWGFSSMYEEGFDALWRRYPPGDGHENTWTAWVGVATV